MRTRIIRGAFWSVVGTAASQGMGFLAYVVAARLLTKDGFGELGIIQSTAGMFGVFAGMGLGLTATKHVAEFRFSERSRAGRLIALSLLAAAVWSSLLGVIVWGLSPYLAAHTLGAPHLSVELRIGSLLLVLTSISGVQTGVLSGLEAFEAVAWTNIWRGIANIVFVSIGTYLWGVTGAVWGLTGTAAVAVMTGHIAVKAEAERHGIPILHRGLSREAGVLWKFTLPAFLSGAVVAPAIWWTRAMLANQPGGFREMAVLTAASNFQSALSLAGYTAGAALLPIMASSGGDNDERLDRGNVLLSWVVGVVVVVPLLCIPESIALVFGRQYGGVAASQTFVLVLVATTIVLYKQGLARVLAASDLMWWGAASNLVWASTLVVVSWWLLGYGARGLAAALLIAYALNTALFLPLYLRRGLAPAGVLSSPQSLIVWATILTLGAASWAGTPLPWRLVLLVGAVIALVSSFKSMLVKRDVGHEALRTAA
ncbi:MAG: oligosaccharide flippase family protein [Bryobacteraceae bacterium]